MKKFLFVLFLIFVSLSACNDTVDNQSEGDVKEEVVNEKTEQTSNVDWKEEIAKVATSEKTKTEKHDEVYFLAKDYAEGISNEELEVFGDYIVSEFTSGKYLSDIENDEYMLENIFKSVVVEKAIEDESDPMKSFAFDFYQNTKYTYRGIDSVDSDEVKSNEEQMKKALEQMK